MCICKIIIHDDKKDPGNRKYMPLAKLIQKLAPKSSLMENGETETSENETEAIE